MSKQKEYAFVLDAKGDKLAPANINKAWILIRKKKAKLLQKYPMAIQLNYKVETNEGIEIICGIDDGSKHVGIALLQKCRTYNKPIFKGTIELRQDVKGLVYARKRYKTYRRNHKRYRKSRFNNRSSSNRKSRIAPSILQKKQSIIRVINRLLKFINIKEYNLEDVVVNIRALTEGKKIYGLQYQKSNRLDENIRKSILLRDGYKCMECGKNNCVLEVHHIVPRRLKGKNNQGNLIALCKKCHDKTKGREEEFIIFYQNMINGKNIRFDYAQHVMQGKTWLRNKLAELGKLTLTTGGDTANKRIEWNIYKTHSNDALVIANLMVDKDGCDIRDWVIKPMRRKSKAITSECFGFKHRDLVKYTKKNGEKYIGYITALYPRKRECNITTIENKILKRYGIKSCKILWRFDKIYWF